MKGTPVLDIDYLMVYPNIIKGQILYVYARDGKITHIAVVDRTQWQKGDFKPPVNGSLKTEKLVNIFNVRRL